ncbi:MAG: carboxypeptidase-like regulatory domain-containing protein, partial [Armatimonadota bacterium]|nr:carboxypeptidase-like regulatory domain-containing protein [Armatimonadota bacterium]
MGFGRGVLGVFAALLLCGAAGCGSSNGGSPLARGSVQGYVFGRTETRAVARGLQPPPGTVAISGATITLTPAEAAQEATDARTPATGRSGLDGLFKISGLVPGPYDVTISATGYQPARFGVVVLANETVFAGVDNGRTVLEPVNASLKRKWTV